MKICFFTSGPVAWASSRMRAYWPSLYLDAVVIPLVEARNGIPQADVYVFQKSFNEWVRESLPPDSLAIWDVCDPSWWFDPDGAKAALAAVDGVTACTEALAIDLRKWDGWENDKPVLQVHDCIAPQHFPIQAIHSDHEPIRFIWYGIHANRTALHAAQATLERLTAEGHSISLTILDERPDINHVFLTRPTFPVYFTEWSLASENKVIASHDIALLPPYPGPWGRLKSKNKQWTAGACGLPVITDQDYSLVRQMVQSAATRRQYADIAAKEAALFRPDYVAFDWEKAIDEISSHQRERTVSTEDTAVFAPA